MTTSASWRITELERELPDGYVFNVVFNVTLDSASAYGSVNRERHNELIAFEDLTEDIIVGWVKSALGADHVKKLEASLATQLNEQQKTTTQSKGLPWE